MNNNPTTFTRSQPGLSFRWIALVSWILIALANLVYFLTDLSSDYAEILVPCTGKPGVFADCNFLAISPSEGAVLAAWGLTMRDYALFTVTVSIIVLLGYWVLGGLILWRLGSSRLGLTVSLALIVIPVSMIAGSNDWSENAPALFILAVIVGILGDAIMLSFLYLLPNGRFSPRWAPVPLAFTFLLLSILTLDVNGIISVTNTVLSLLSISILSLVLLGGGLQIYRYRNDSNPVERQQTKWILFGILAFVMAVMIWVLVFGGALEFPAGQTRLLAVFIGGVLIAMAELCLPAAIAIAILRYRLWDIDLIIRKTLVFAVLTGLLLLVYFGVVVLLQSLFESVSGQQSPLVIVISTLVIAALFAPLRRRVQAVIDRRFFRKKYDAQQVLAHFAQTAQNETEMDLLMTELSAVVRETMQPEQMTIWLKENGN